VSDVDKLTVNPTPAPFHHSRLIKAGNLLFLAGHVARKGGTAEVTGDVPEQTAEILRQFEAALESVGCSLAKLVKVTAYLTKKEDFAPFEATYKQFFPNNPPARTTVLVELLPSNALVEMDGIATM
jgi:2-iminobutanoate/2-iminopropanoate deaminase